MQTRMTLRAFRWAAVVGAALACAVFAAATTCAVPEDPMRDVPVLEGRP